MDRPQVKDLLHISTVFDHGDDSTHRLLYSGSIRTALQRLLPSDFFFMEDPQASLEEMNRVLPVIKWSEWGTGSINVSIFLLCRHRVNGMKFFYEMISRWLMPGKRPHVSSFFATDFTFSQLSNEAFTISEIVVSLEDAVDLELIRRQLPILESEIRLGLLSVYHANRILEIKGLSADEKTSLIQERIASLLERRPADFDHDIFTQMQHFLVMCGEEFKAVRGHAHMSRIIYVFYLFIKALRDQTEKHPGQRFIHVKLSKAYLYLPFGLKKVVGVFVALNFLSHDELFEERHFSNALISHFPEISIVQDSFFSRTSKEDHTQILYVEIEKKDSSDFSLTEMKRIKDKLPDEIRNGIEKLTRPLFMPRNEEEVMRNIITLSNQLKFSKDLPQVVITFDELLDVELCFTVIWLRVVKPGDSALQEIFEKNSSWIKLAPDRVKRLGMIRNKYPKEATVFRARFPVHRFLRSDQSVDLFKARQSLVCELHQIFGEFRDYNGGMIAKQHEQFLALRGLFSHLDRHEEMLLENFFHSIFPIELRSLFNPLLLKNLFNMLLNAINKNRENERKIGAFYQTDGTCCYFLLAYDSLRLKDMATAAIQSIQIPSSQLLMVDLQAFESSYLGYIYLEGKEEHREKFLQNVCIYLENLTFEPQTSYH
jgi:hypothetical protein